jgi:Na+-transporting NADH:ubiquinone oxidoreductase subunit A
MAVHRIRRGLDLPIPGAPQQVIHEGPALTRVALLGADHPGLRARLHVEEGETVRRGQLLFEDRANPGVHFTSPAAGRVCAVRRGHRRVLESVVVELSTGERSGSPSDGELVAFESRQTRHPETLGGEQVRALLLESGLWTALRTRPFGKVPAPEATPFAVFVNAMDTQPLAARPEVVIGERRADFELGLRLVARLTAGTTFLCVTAGSELARGVDAPVSVEEFRGPHPSGTAGVHIHLLAPVSRRRTAWTLHYQDAIAIGELFRTGRLPVARVVALGGPPVRTPRLVRSRLGASVDEHVRGELTEDEVRLISGSVLSGRTAAGPTLGFLGQTHLQISVLREGRRREFLGWAAPGRRRFSTIPVFLSRLLRPRQFDFTTSTHGSRRAIVPIGLYERVVPLDIVPTYLLRALVVGDVEQAEKLGALELEEEDLALCTFVDPGKTEFGPFLRLALERLEKEG